MSSKFRRSETIEQHEYEKQIHEQQLGADSTTSTEDLTSKLQSSKLEEDSENGRTEKKGVFRALKDRIKASFPEAIQDVKIMKGLTALEMRVKKEIQDSTIFPEVQQVAELHVRDAFAKYFDLNPEEIHPDDVPTVSFGGSGGGFRAMIGCLAYCDAFKQAGLWDCLTYVSGVSGACWSLAAYYTFGLASMQNVLEHCKKRFAPYHPLSGEAIRNILSVPGGARTTLGPLIQKSQSGLQTVAMDLYSVFTTGWIFFQDDPASHPDGSAKKEAAGYQRSWYKYSSAHDYTDSGAEPLPIMTAIRRERPWKDWADKEHPFKEPNHSAEEHDDANAWFQWFEMTPYEIGCDEIEAWVPTWAFGRPFLEGKSTMQLPEQSLALLLGLCTSAPAGPLTSYIATVSRNLPPGFLGNSIHGLAHGVTKLWGKQGTEEFQNHHPLHACNEHNFMYHFTPVNESETRTRPPGLENSPRLHLIDSGMDNNCPTYVLLHPARKADVIINMDASSDVAKDTFADRVNQIGNRRGLKFTKRHSTSDPSTPNRYAQIYDGTHIPRPDTVLDSYGKTVPSPPAPVYPPENGGVTMVYMPLLPNEKAVKDFDPSTAKFSGSYNLVWTAEQVRMLVDVCRANFEEGEGLVREVLWEAYVRKKRVREENQ